MQAQDRRVKRTHSLLSNALIKLTLEKGYDAVTIRDITEQADIGYATFFRHYKDKDILLHEVLDVVLAEMIALLPHGSASDSAEVGTLIFKYVQEHQDVIQVLLRTRGSSDLLQHMLESGSESILHKNKPRPGSPVPAEVAAYHIVSSSIALIQWWLDHDRPYPPEQMGIIYQELIANPTSKTAFLA
ncbi:MAG TPA: TetR/AcrR family transcriptional regulator [Ktedonobacteraceae bacterium]|nr:TetR/AcrR family transcriptional regulator [Ktedonobacteraceae bacterium]